MKPDFAKVAESKVAESYDEAAVLARETGRRMAERLDLVKIKATCVADIGCATGDGIRELQKRYPQALPLAIDLSQPMLRQVGKRVPLLTRLKRSGPKRVSADVRALPIRPSSIDLAWSNLMLHWLEDPQPALKELHRVLDTGGLLMFTALGPDTLKELRGAAEAAGTQIEMRRFLDMHDLGDMLVGAGFADPVMDMEVLTLTYRQARSFLSDQRHLGVSRLLFGQTGWRNWRRVFGAWARNDEGLLSASFEIIYGHAWKPESRQNADGRSIIKFHRPS